MSSQRNPRHERNRPVAALVASILVFGMGCIYDPDAPCGTELTASNGQCLCPEGTVSKDGIHCEPCGENERPASVTCLCIEGFVRDAEDGVCRAAGDALGSPCDPGEACEDETYSYCAASETEEGGYCTRSRCESDGECDGGYGCDLGASPSYCARRPSGMGEPCTSSKECEGFEASYCETFRSNTCLVDECAGPEVECRGGTVCCDFGPLGVPLSLCLNSSVRKDGCPLGGTMLEGE